MYLPISLCIFCTRNYKHCLVWKCDLIQKYSTRLNIIHPIIQTFCINFISSNYLFSERLEVGTKKVKLCLIRPNKVCVYQTLWGFFVYISFFGFVQHCEICYHSLYPLSVHSAQYRFVFVLSHNFCIKIVFHVIVYFQKGGTSS